MLRISNVSFQMNYKMCKRKATQLKEKRQKCKAQTLPLLALQPWESHFPSGLSHFNGIQHVICEGLSRSHILWCDCSVNCLTIKELGA